MNQRVWAGCFAVAVGLMPSLATAGDILLAPMIGRGVKSTTLTNITSLIFSELDFNSQVSGVSEISAPTPTLTSSCLKSVTCLKSIGRMGDGEEQLLTGYVTVSGGAFVIQMVLFDNRSATIVRNKTFTLGASPEALADGMTNVLKEVLTGVSKKDTAKEDNFDFDVEDDDFDFEDPSVADAENDVLRREEAARKAKELERRRAAEAQRRRAEETRQRQEAEAARQRAAEEEARRQRAAAEQARQRRDAEVARQRKEAEDSRKSASSDDFDPNAFTFGSSSIIIEDEGETPSPTAYNDLDLEEAEFLGNDVVMLDLDENTKPERTRTQKPERTAPERTSRPTESRTRTSRESDDTPIRFQLTARGGYSAYFNLGFITYGAEGAIAIGETGLFVLGGVEAYSVNRDIPDEFQDSSGQTTEWNTIFPINVGLSYRILKGSVQPYIGGDAIFAQYYVNANGGSWSAGARARTGVNLMVSRKFGFNLNVAIGFWSGKNWALIQSEVKTAGLLPQVSAGTVFAF